jgi:hypothetical protein
MDRVSDTGVLEILLITLVIYVFIPLALLSLGIWILVKIIRAPDKNKKAKSQERGNQDDFRCLGCGADIAPNQQSCQKCGWTWK